MFYFVLIHSFVFKLLCCSDNIIFFVGVIKCSSLKIKMHLQPHTHSHSLLKSQLEYHILKNYITKWLIPGFLSFFSISVVLYVDHLSCLSAAENKPIWMHAEEREEMSKVGYLLKLFLNSF